MSPISSDTAGAVSAGFCSSGRCRRCRLFCTEYAYRQHSLTAS